VVLLDGLLEGREGSSPKEVEILAEHGYAVRVELVDVAVAGGLVDHEPRVLQNVEVLGDGGATDRHLLREFADRARPLGE
jgi:hypothetical protein